MKEHLSFLKKRMKKTMRGDKSHLLETDEKDSKKNEK